jgi:hypothetical protein
VPGERIGVRGHGLRTRLQLGPPGLLGPPEEVLIEVRRYRCRRCGAVIVVAPRDVLPLLRYRARAVVMALAYLAQGEPSPAIRRRVSPQSVLGHEGRRSWRAPSRWARRSSSLWSIRAGPPEASPRALALSAVRQLAGRSPSMSGDLLTDALAAIEHGPRP